MSKGGFKESRWKEALWRGKEEEGNLKPFLVIIQYLKENLIPLKRKTILKVIYSVIFVRLFYV